jgi:carboxyl-terminal processing protease
MPALEDRAYAAGKLYAALQTHFAHWADVPAGFDEDSAYRAYLAAAFAAPDQRAYALATTRFVATMRNGHTWIYDTLLGTDRGHR